MPSRELYIRHQFSGGWATSFGSEIDGAPDAGGIVTLPFLLNAEDIMYNLDGGPRCVPGTTQVNSVEMESGTAINGVFDFWLTGSLGTPAQHRIVHVGTKIKKDDADGTFTDLFTGMTAGATPCYSVLEDILVISSNGGDVPKSWDGSTAQSLAGSPPPFQFSEVHKNYLWAAGDPAYPSRLYFCVVLDPEDWSGAGSGYIDIDPSDGDGITGLASHKNDLFVFKGPHKGAIHRITGSAPTGSDPFARSTFASGIGCVSHQSIFRFGDDLGFMWSDGTVRSLSATAAFGDFKEASLSLGIDTWLREHLTIGSLRKVQAVNWSEQGVALFSVPVDGSTANNYILMMDYRFGAPRWASWPSFSTAGVSLGIVVDTANRRRLVMGGGSDGFLRRFGQPTRSIDGATALQPKITTPFMSYGTPIMMKTLSAAAVGITPRNNGDFTLAWTRDGNTQQTTTLNQSSGDVLAPAAANQFTLGTSTLGGGGFVQRFVELEEGGEFRSIQYEIAQSVNNNDLEVHTLAARVQPGAWSTENV